jgi:hypothetical protein
MSEREALVSEVTRRLGDRRLVWAGLRGDDIEPLLDVPQTDAAFSIIAAYSGRRTVEALAHEDLTGVRVDLDAWDIDDELTMPATQEFRRAMLAALARPSALVAYRPSRFLSAIWFARKESCVSLSLFGAHQAAFEHKPWVESAIAALGVPTIPWVYVADEERERVRRLVQGGSVMLRRTRGSGGAGMVRIDDPDEVDQHWPQNPEAFVSVTPYLDQALPLNVGATVWSDAVTVHRASVQLIGIEQCVTRPFGYCGNDFSVAANLETGILESVEKSVLTIGTWLRSFGYLGTFGVDFLVYRGVPLFTEVNARFQGSTALSCRLSIEEDMPCLLLEHVAAMLGCEPLRDSRTLQEAARDTRPRSQLIVHWVGEEPQMMDGHTLADLAMEAVVSTRADVVCSPELVVHRGGVVARLTAASTMTTDGYELTPVWRKVIDEWAEAELGERAAGDDWGDVAVHR